MKQDVTLDELMDNLKKAVRDKNDAEQARVRAEEKKRKANSVYNMLMDTFRAKEYRI